MYVMNDIYINDRLIWAYSRFCGCPIDPFVYASCHRVSLLSCLELKAIWGSLCVNIYSHPTVLLNTRMYSFSLTVFIPINQTLFIASSLLHFPASENYYSTVYLHEINFFLALTYE